MDCPFLAIELQTIMHIGLMRYFPVKKSMPGRWMPAVELHQWRQEYEVIMLTSLASVSFMNALDFHRGFRQLYGII